MRRAGRNQREEEWDDSPGCLSRLVGLITGFFLLLLVLALGFALWPQNLTDIKGYAEAQEPLRPRDLRKVLEAAKQQDYELSLSESEINRYIQATLKMNQGGLLAKYVTWKGVYIRLQEAKAEIVMVREIAGYTFTNSMYLRIERKETADGRVTTEVLRNGGPYMEGVNRPLTGGRFGRLKIPEGFLLLTLPAFDKLAAIYGTPGAVMGSGDKELDLLINMSRIEFKKNQLFLNGK